MAAVKAKVNISGRDDVVVVPLQVPSLDEVRTFAKDLHYRNQFWTGQAFGWSAEYNPERSEPPLDSKMKFTPADFCIGESGIWFFSMMWEEGRERDPVEYVDEVGLVKEV